MINNIKIQTILWQSIILLLLHSCGYRFVATQPLLTKIITRFLLRYHECVSEEGTCRRQSLDRASLGLPHVWRWRLSFRTQFFYLYARRPLPTGALMVEKSYELVDEMLKNHVA